MRWPTTSFYTFLMTTASNREAIMSEAEIAVGSYVRDHASDPGETKPPGEVVEIHGTVARVRWSNGALVWIPLQYLRKVAAPKRERSYYAPYDTYPAFDQGLEAYNQLAKAKFVRSIECPYDHNSVDAQAWDRGYEYGSYLYWYNRRNLPDGS